MLQSENERDMRIRLDYVQLKKKKNLNDHNLKKEKLKYEK